MGWWRTWKAALVLLVHLVLCRPDAVVYCETCKLAGGTCEGSSCLWKTSAGDYCFISAFQVCNGEDDCQNGNAYDELNCCRVDGMLDCDKSKMCYTVEQVCDGTYNCTKNSSNGFDNTDERNCSSCPSGSFHCTVTRNCVKNELVCDGNDDCGGTDKSDEEGCTTLTSSPSSSAPQTTANSPASTSPPPTAVPPVTTPVPDPATTEKDGDKTGSGSDPSLSRSTSLSIILISFLSSVIGSHCLSVCGW